MYTRSFDSVICSQAEIYCADCFTIFRLSQEPLTCCPVCLQSVQTVAWDEGIWRYKIQTRPLAAAAVLAACSEPTKLAKKVKKDTFWKDHIVKLSMVNAALDQTLKSLQGEVTCKFRIRDDAKRALAEALETMLEATFHRVHLLTHHRGKATPTKQDWELAEVLSSEAKFQESLDKARARAQEPQPKRRRLRPLAAVAVDESMHGAAAGVVPGAIAQPEEVSVPQPAELAPAVVAEDGASRMDGAPAAEELGETAPVSQNLQQ